MALSRCAITHRGPDGCFWRGTPAIVLRGGAASVQLAPAEAGQATGGPCPALEAKRLHRHPVAPSTTTAIRHTQVTAVTGGKPSSCWISSTATERGDLGAACTAG